MAIIIIQIKLAILMLTIYLFMIPNIITVLVFGLCFGSFITMASYRFGDKTLSIKQFLWQRSFCPKCHNQLKIRHLIPLFSWAFFKGSCGFCRQKISLRYPLIELITALTFLTIFLILGNKIDLRLILILSMSVTLLIMIITDLEHYFIPDITQIILAVLAIVYHIALPHPTTQNPYFLPHELPYYLLSAFAFYFFGIVLFYGSLLIIGKQGIGSDDLKFFAVAGLMLGLDNFITFMVLSGLIGTIFGSIWTKVLKDRTFPFAPALAIAFLISTLLKINYLEWLGMLLYLFEKYITKTSY